jgi:CelD/BcsL family acetyltransferase involved in cellulose biosynthesis
MNRTVTRESFSSLLSLRDESSPLLNWELIFVSPVWLKVWWDVFGDDRELFLTAVRENGQLTGVAPLIIKNGTASLIGSTDLCDYLDFIAVPGKEQVFFNAVLDELKSNGVRELNLESLRPDSTTLLYLADIALSRGYEVTITPDEVSLELDLPGSWDEYLGTLNSKQRHEIRRKLRRLKEAGEVRYRTTGEPEEVREVFGTFIKLFRESRNDKADFLTEKREFFLRSMTDAMSAEGILKLGILELDSVTVAVIMFFDYNDTIYLYNSGFDRNYDSLSVGLLSKALCIRESIESGRKVFDFLKGDELYKSRLGGKETRLCDCLIDIK